MLVTRSKEYDPGQGGIGALNQLLGDMCQAKKEFIEEKIATTDALKKEEEAKLDSRQEMIIKDLQNKKKGEASEGERYE